MRFPKAEYKTKMEIPQDYELFGGLFGPLGLFAFAFVRLERTLSWSYVVSETDCAKLDALVLLSKAAEFEGGTKRASDRIAKWFNTLRSCSNQDSWTMELSKVKSRVERLNNHRNRLLHDPSGGFSQEIGLSGASEPEFQFTQQMKSGETRTRHYSAKRLIQLVDETLLLKTEIRRLTIMVIPDALAIEI